jgi:PKHD-type hydroxylase
MSEINDEIELLSHYFIPSQMSKEICNTIIKDFFDERYLEKSLVSNKSKFKPEVRSSSNRWIYTDSWIAGMMSHFILCANKSYFDFDLEGWNDQIQFTVYDSPGDHYNWHIDVMKKPKKYFIRKLSIVMCLSSKNDYGGGELQLFHPTKKCKTFKLDAGDVIIFPSIVSHRVKPVTSGRRISLVGWYGGPPFR